MPSNIFGIDIGPRSLKVAAVEKRLRGVEIKRLKSVPVEGLSDEELSSVLRRTLADMGYDQDDDQVAAVFPAEKLSSRVLNVPLTNPRQISETLSYELEALTPFDAEDMVCDFVTIETTEKDSLILAAIALKEDVSPFINTLHSAGAFPDRLIPSPLASLPAVSGLDLPHGEAAAVIDIGYRSTSVTITTGASPLAFHNTPMGAVDIIGEDDNAEEKARKALIGEVSSMIDVDDEFSVPLGTFATSISRELNRLVKSAFAEKDLKITRVFITGELGDSARLRRALSSKLGSQVETASLPYADSADSVYSAAMGAALLSAGVGVVKWMSLSHGDTIKKRRISKSREQAFLAAGLLAFTLIMGAASFVTEEIQLRNRYESLKGRTRDVFKTALPDVKKIVSETQQLKNALEEVRDKSRSLGAGLKANDPFLDRLYEISQAGPEDVKLDVDELLYEQGKIIISGRTTSFEKVELFKKNLESLEWTKTVAVDKAKAAIEGGVNFKLGVDIYQ